MDAQRSNQLELINPKTSASGQDCTGSVVVMKEAEQDAGEFGAALRHAREARHLSIEAVSRACMLSDQQIIGLESADYRAFYSCEYARRAAQRYAQFLQVQAVPVIESTDGEIQAGLDQRGAISLIRIRRRARTNAWRVLLLGVISACALAAALIVWDRYGLAWEPRGSDASVPRRAPTPADAAEHVDIASCLQHEARSALRQCRSDPTGRDIRYR